MNTQAQHTFISPTNEKRPTTRIGKRREANAPPNDPDLRPLHLPLRTVDIRDPLPEVKLGVFFRGDAFDLDEGCVGAGVALGAFVAEDAAFAVESLGGGSWG
jgi:hypothetical protein